MIQLSVYLVSKTNKLKVHNCNDFGGITWSSFVDIEAKNINLVFRATVLKTLGRVGSVIFIFLIKN